MSPASHDAGAIEEKAGHCPAFSFAGEKQSPIARSAVARP
jgi:hypothetical protein